MKIQRLSGVYLLKSTQVINTPIEEVWDFFSTPINLQRITPDDINFSITGETAEKMREGDIISYKIGIFPIVKTNWVTEIKSVKEGHSFIDEQRFGPYKMWHHRHTFESIENGTLMTDEIHFRPPFQMFSRIIVAIFIKPKLIKIFSHRRQFVDQFFNSTENE